MDLISMLPILRQAQEQGYGQPAFNVACYPQVKAVLEAHNILRSPAVVQAGTIAMAYLGQADDYNNATDEDRKNGAHAVMKMVRSLKDEIDIPVAVHADHVKDYETIKMLIEAGFTSVMIDGSHLPFKENIELTREVVVLAHKSNVSVEAELGILSGVEDDITSDECHYTNPMDVVDFVEKTDVDALALSYGTKHGARKGLDVKLRKQIVVASRENLSHKGYQTPLVSHGSSTVPRYIVDDINNCRGSLTGLGGIPLTELKDVIASGISKINIDTDMRLSITRNIREFVYSSDSGGIWDDIRKRLEKDPSEIDYRAYLNPFHTALTSGNPPSNKDSEDLFFAIDKAVKEIVFQLLVQFGAVGKAGMISIPERVG